jgi:hypothetical protein
MKTVACLLTGFVIPLLAGCAGIGPQTISRDRFDYTAAISDLWKRQMLIHTSGSTTGTCCPRKSFLFLMFVFILVETGEKGAAPIVTIPTG